MGQERCIFCMSETADDSAVCRVCKKGIWEYHWQEAWLEPYTVLKEKYLVGAVISEDGIEKSPVYIGYDKILEQKIAIREYTAQEWEQIGEKESRLLFGQFEVPGLIAVKDYFTEGGKGYAVMAFQEGEPLSRYMKKHGSMAAQEAFSMLKPVLEGLSYLHGAGLINGRVSPDTLMVNEEGKLVLTGRIAAPEKVLPSERTTVPGKELPPEEERQQSPYLAPEQCVPDGITGPWSDIYALCAVWYEMFTGRKVPFAAERMERDRLKKPSKDREIEGQIEQALLQGLEVDVQRRYFCTGNLLERMGVTSPQTEQRLGIIRHIWGEPWLKATEFSQVSGRRRRGKKYLWKKVFAAVLAVLCISGAAAGGIYLYAGTHREEIFVWKSERAREANREDFCRLILTPDAPEYEETLRFIETYGSWDENSSGERLEYYDISKEDAQKAKGITSTSPTFYLDKDTVSDALLYYLDLEGRADLERENDTGYSTIQKTENREINLALMQKDVYKIRRQGEQLEITSDLPSGRVSEISYTGEEKNCALILENIIPLLVPETYLTEEEAGEIMAEVGEDGCRLDLTAKCEVEIFPREEGAYHLTIYAQGCMQKNQLAEEERAARDDTQYAGNYERGSSRYEEFTAYVKEHALTQEKTEEPSSLIANSRNAFTYTLSAEDVKNWGEPCNVFRYPVQKEVLEEELKAAGYEMEKIEEKEKNSVEIQEYGDILTNFWHLETYRMSGQVFVVIGSDTVNGEVLQALVYGENGDISAAGEATDISVAEAAADVTELLDRLSEETSETLAQEIEDGRQKAGAESETQFETVENTILMYAEYRENGIGVYITPVEVFHGAEYYWP